MAQGKQRHKWLFDQTHQNVDSQNSNDDNHGCQDLFSMTEDCLAMLTTRVQIHWHPHQVDNEFSHRVL